MTILLHKPYFKKVTRERGLKTPKILTTWFIDDLLSRKLYLHWFMSSFDNVHKYVYNIILKTV